MMDKAAPIPDQQAVAEKEILHLVVQLSKRWRDIYYANVDPKLAPISIVLTTLAAETYRGERSVSQALTSMLGGVVDLIDVSRRRGEQRLHLCNPSNVAEDLTERWDSNPPAYAAFVRGIRDFQRQWVQLVRRGGNVNAELEVLFGEPVKTVLRKQAQKMQESRMAAIWALKRESACLASNASARVMPNISMGQSRYLRQKPLTLVQQRYFLTATLPGFSRSGYWQRVALRR